MPSQRADAALLDRVYRGLLDRLPLSPVHREGLRGRGLGDNAIDRRGYRSLPGQERVRIARELAEIHGDALLTVPGFHVTQRPGRRPFPSIAGGGTGTLIPVRDQAGLIAGLLVRLDLVEPDGQRYFWLSSRKRGGPGPGCLCHVPLGIATPAQTLRLTEGGLKADIAFELSGLPTIGLPSPGAWRTAIPVLLALDVPEVLLALDADWLVNPHVAQALATMAQALRAAGLRVGVELWDEPKGIDDLFASGGCPEVRWLEGRPS